MKQLERHSATGLLDKYLDYLQLVGLAARTVSISGESGQASEGKHPTYQW